MKAMDVARISHPRYKDFKVFPIPQIHYDEALARLSIHHRVIIVIGPPTRARDHTQSEYFWSQRLNIDEGLRRLH